MRKKNETTTEKEKITWKAEPPNKIRCQSWPEINGTDPMNENWKTKWIDPLKE